MKTLDDGTDPFLPEPRIPASRQQIVRGWRVFHCDECGAQWESASRDHASPSGEDCACGEWVMPHASRPDDTLPVNELGNLLHAYKRKNRAFTLVEVLVALAIFATVIVLLVPAFQSARAASKRKQDIEAGRIPPGDPVANAQPTWSLRTVRHDNHLWVVSTGNADHFVHHPDCPCQKPAEKP